MTRDFLQATILPVVLLTLCSAGAYGDNSSEAVRINKEAYDALQSVQDAVDNQDWPEAIRRRKEAETILLRNAEEFASSGDVESALGLYEMVMNDNIHELSDDENRVCRSLTTAIPVTRENVFTQLIWSCPDRILADWVGGSDELDKLEPKATSQPSVDYPIHHGESELVARAYFDVNSDGNVTNLVIDCESEEFSEAVLSSLHDTTFVPAMFRGKPIYRPRMVRMYVWEPAN